MGKHHSANAPINIGQKIRNRRIQKEWTQEDVASRAGIDVSSLSRIERGIRNPSVNLASQIAQALDVPLAELLSGSEEQEPDEPPPSLRLVDYIAFSEVIHDPDTGGYLTYGIKVFYSISLARRGHKTVHDVCVHSAAAYWLAELLTEQQLSPIHLFDAVEDFLCELL